MKVGFINKKIFEEDDISYITTEKRFGQHIRIWVSGQ